MALHHLPHTLQQAPGGVIPTQLPGFKTGHLIYAHLTVGSSSEKESLACWSKCEHLKNYFNKFNTPPQSGLCNHNKNSLKSNLVHITILLHYIKTHCL